MVGNYESKQGKKHHEIRHYQQITECYSKSFDANDTPIALDISKKVLTLPIYPDLEATDVERICDIIRREL